MKHLFILDLLSVATKMQRRTIYFGKHHWRLKLSKNNIPSQNTLAAKSNKD